MPQEYNLPEVYRLDESKLPELRERLKRKIWKITAPIFLGVILLNIYVNPLKDIAELSFLVVAMMIIFIIVINRSLKKVVEQYRKYCLLIHDKGVTSIFRMEKEIEWEYAKLKLNSSSEITIINLKLNELRRFFDERGVIIIPPELENYEKLKQLLFKRVKTV